MIRPVEVIYAEEEQEDEEEENYDETQEWEREKARRRNAPSHRPRKEGDTIPRKPRPDQPWWKIW